MKQPPNYLNRRRTLLVLGLCMALALSGDLTLYAVLPAFAPARGLSLASVGLLLSANRLVRLPLNPLVGLLFNNRRRRPWLLLSYGLGTISTFLYIYSAGEGWFVAARMLWGSAWSLMLIGGYCVVMDVSGQENRGQGSGVLQSFYFIALAVHPLLGGLLSDQFSYETALWVCTALSASGFLLALFALPETLPLIPTAQQKQGIVPLRTRLSAIRQKIRLLLNLPNFTVNYINLLVFFAGEGMFMSTITLFLAQQLGGSLTIGGIVLPAATAGGAALAFRSTLSAGAAPIAGRLSDRLGSRWGVLAVGLICGSAGMGLLGLVPSPVLLVIGVVLAAVCTGFSLAILPALMNDLNPAQSSGTLMGILSTTGDIGMAVAPLVAYSLTGALTLPVVYLLGAGAILTGLPLLVLSSRRQTTAAGMLESE